MEKKKASLILLIALFFSAGIAAFAYFCITTVDVKDYDMHITLEGKSKVGIIVDTDKVWFGITNPGGAASRKLVVTNNFTFPVVVKIFLYGKLGDYVSLSESNIMLEPNTFREIDITANMPHDAALGEYTGKVRAVFKRRF